MTGVLTYGLDWHRGIDMSTGLDLEGHLESWIADLFRSSLKAGISLRGAGQFQVGIPLDLFSDPGGGLLALLRVQAEAAGYVQATVEASGAPLAKLIEGALPDPLSRLITIFLEEIQVEAGVWAHCGVCAQVVAEAKLTAQLLPVEKAGFTCSFQFAAGWYYGYGMNYLTNFTFPDSRRLLNRTSSLVSDILLDEANSHIATLRGTDPVAAEVANEAMSYLRVLLPVATRTLFELAAQLATTEHDQHASVATRSVLDSLFAQAQQMALDALVNLGLAEIDRWLGAHGVLERFLAQADQVRQETIADLTALSAQLKMLEGFSVAQPKDWYTAVVACLAPLERLAASALVPADIRPTIDTIWSATRLMETVIPWVQGYDQRPEPFAAQATALDVAGAQQAALRVSTARGVAPDKLQPAELVAFLVEDLHPLQHLAQLLPETRQTLGWIGELTGCDPDDLLRDVLTGALTLTEDDIGKRVAALTAAAASALEGHVLPHLIDPLIAQADEDMRIFLEQLVRPTLIALPQVVLPRIGDLSDPDDKEAGKRLAEAISGVLLQTSAHYVTHATDVIADHWITAAIPQFEKAADEIDHLGAESPIFSAVAGMGVSLFVGADVQPGDVRDLLRLCTRAMQLWNDNQRHQILEATRLSLDLGLRIDGNNELNTILNSDNPPNLPQLERAYAAVTEGLWTVITDPELLEGMLAMPYNHTKNQVETVIRVVEAIAAEVEHGVQVALDAFNTWVQQIKDLEAAVNRLAGEALAEVTQAAHTIQTLGHDILDQMHDYAHGILGEVVNNLPEPIQSLVRDAAETVFEEAWTAAAGGLAAPLDVLVQIADWLNASLGAMLRSGATNVEVIRSQIRTQIFAIDDPTIDIPLLVPNPLFPVPPLIQVGTVSVPGAGLLGILADAILGNPTVQGHIDIAVGKTKERLNSQSQKQTLENATASHYTKADAEAAAKVLQAHPTVSVFITDPVDRSVHDGPVLVTVRAEGADENYVNHPVLNTPSRMRVLVNDRELDTHGRWRPDGTAMTYQFLVIPPATDEPPDKTPWAEEAWHDPDPMHDIFHRKLWQAIGVAGVNTVAVACLDAHGPPAQVSFSLPMPHRVDWLTYDRASGNGAVFSTAVEGILALVTNPGQGGDWTAAAAGEFVDGAKSNLGCYHAGNGMWRWFTMDTSGKFTATNESTLGTGWTQLTAGHYLGRELSELHLYNAGTGAAALWVPDPAGGPGELISQPSIGTGWTSLVSGPFGNGTRDRLLVYRASDGTVETHVADLARELYAERTGLTLAASWTNVVAGYFGGPHHRDLYCYNSTNGAAQLWDLDPVGVLAPLGDPTAPGTGGPLLMTAGDYFHSGGNNYLWVYVQDSTHQIGVFLRPEPSDPNTITPGIAQLPLNIPATDVLSGRFA